MRLEGSCWDLQKPGTETEHQREVLTGKQGIQDNLDLYNKARHLGPRWHPNSGKELYQPLPLLAILLASEMEVQGMEEVVFTRSVFLDSR